MPGATADGVFSALNSQGVTVAAKTGTAQRGDTCATGTDNWMIAMAPAAPGQVPAVAVAATIPTPENACVYGNTGASTVGPVIAPMLASALAAVGK